MNSSAPQIVVDRAPAEEQHKQKTKLCRHYARGFCHFGNGCMFAHGERELRFDADHSVVYKTELCRFWTDGLCRNGSKCRWAHGSHELRPMQNDSADIPTSSSSESANMPSPSRLSRTAASLSGNSPTSSSATSHMLDPLHLLSGTWSMAGGVSWDPMRLSLPGSRSPSDRLSDTDELTDDTESLDKDDERDETVLNDLSRQITNLLQDDIPSPASGFSSHL